MTTEQTPSIIEVIRQAWAWVGLEPAEIVEENNFGNLLVKDVHGKYWRICPEDAYCCIVATDLDTLAALVRNENFLRDWKMAALAKLAREKLGPLTPGNKYCLNTPTRLGGSYESANLGIISLTELIRNAGALAKDADTEQ
jgi:hypothetical protein